jgi:glycosyltransferase involved in cell wall biosynthesis
MEHNKKTGPLKIVHISSSFKGGAGTSAYRIHQSLLKAGIDSHFICLDKNINRENISFPRNDSYKKQPNIYQLFQEKIKWRLKHHFNINLYRKEELIKKIREISPLLNCEIITLPFSDFDLLEDAYVKSADIIHLHWIAGILDYPSFFKKNTKPVVWTLHDMNSFQGIFHYKEDEVRNKNMISDSDKKIALLKRRSIRKRKSKLALVAPSQWLLDAALGSASFRKVKGFKIPYPLDMEIFKRQPDSSLKEKLAIPESHTIFLFVAHRVNNYRKGFDLLEKALQQVNDQSITLLVIGNSEKLEKGIRVITLGRIEDESTLATYYSLADAFIIPSREDNLPNVMLESLACGTPVISFNEGGMCEIIQDEFNGIKAEKKEEEELAMAIKTFIKIKRSFSSEAIRNFALDNFSEKIIAEKYKAVYQDILN